MNALYHLARSLCGGARASLRGALAPARRPAGARRRRKASLQVEQLEGRIALSQTTLVPAPVAGDPLAGLSAGPTWFLEVRKAHARGSKWHWEGPFTDAAKTKAQLRHHGLAVRGQRQVQPGDLGLPDLQNQLPPLPDGLPPLGPDPGPGGPGPGPVQQYLQGFEVQGLHPIYGWIPMNPREIFTDAASAYQDVLSREALYYPIVYQYVSVSLPADQWHVLGNRIYPNF